MKIMKGDSDLLEDDGFITVYPEQFQRGIVPLSSNKLPEHGSPQDRGSADRYYGRTYSPHWYPNGTGHEPRIEIYDMTSDEIFQYSYGWNNEEDRKEW